MTGAIDPGQLRHRYVIESEIETADGLGGSTVQWTKQFDVWAQIKPVSARLVTNAGATMPEISHIFIIRYRDDVMPGMRFVNAGNQFLIDATYDPDLTGRYLKCETRQV